MGVMCSFFEGAMGMMQISQHPVLYTLNMPRATRAMRVKVACAKLSGCAVATSGSPGRRMWSGGVDLLVVSDVGAKCHCSAAGDAVQKVRLPPVVRSPLPSILSLEHR